MGASQPKKENPIWLNLIINGQPFTSNHEVDSGAPAPILGLQAIANAKDSEGKEIPVKVNVKNNSINSSDNTTTDNTNGETSSTCGRNIDNNIRQNALNNSSFNIFNNNNLENIDNNITNTLDEKNKSEKNNNNEIKNSEINNYEKPHQNENNNNNEIKNNNEINNRKKSDNKENKNNNDNNFLKEGVQQRTKFGDEEEEESKEKKPETNRGNEIDINIGKKESILNSQGNTDNGNLDINVGSRFAKEGDKYKEYNYSESDFEISQKVNLSEEKTLEESQVLLDKGLFPLFIKLNDYKPQLFYAERNTTLKIILKVFFDKTPGIDESILKDIKLYSGKNPLDINKEIQYLNLDQYNYNIITNKPTD